MTDGAGGAGPTQRPGPTARHEAARRRTILLCAVVAVLGSALAVVAWRAGRANSAHHAVAVATPTSVAPVALDVPTTLTTVASPMTGPPATTAAATSADPTPPPTTVDPAAMAVTAPPTVASTDSPAPAIVDGPSAACPSTEHGAIVDRASQRAWLCGDGATVAELPITSAWTMPDPGTYPVYAKDLKASSTFGGHFSRMTHFVAFTYGKRTGARIAFHSVPTLNSGAFVQPLTSVGTLGQRGDSSGCIRVLPDDAVRVWEWLSVGDEVHVVS